MSVDYLLLANRHFSQGPNALRIVQNVKGSAVSDDRAFQRLRSCVSDSVLYTLTCTGTETGRAIYWYDLRNKNNGRLNLDCGKKSSLQTSNIWGFQKFGNRFFILGSDEIFIVGQQHPGKYKLEKTLPNQHNFHSVKLLGDRLFLYVDYHFHKLDAAYRHVWAVLDPETYEIGQFTVQPEENTVFSPLINSWTDVCNGKIAYASTTEYKVRIFDENFRLIDSISTNEFEGNKAFMSKINAADLDSKDGIAELRDYEAGVLTRIRKVYFLNDSTISLLIHPPVSGEADRDSIRMHYWQKSGGEWSKVRTDLSTSWFRSASAYSSFVLPYNDFYQNAYDLSYLGSYLFAEVYYPYIPTVATDSFDVDRDFYSKQNEAIRSKNPHLGIKIIRADPFDGAR